MAATLPTEGFDAEAARAWLDFVASDAAFKILERYGFRRFVVKPQ
jgi:ABC-type molybdate transport system substrate-binding protein